GDGGLGVGGEWGGGYVDELGAVSDLDARTYAFDALPDGTRLTPLMRTVYRDALVRGDEGVDEPPPPSMLFGGDAAAIERWFTEPLQSRDRVGRLLEGLWRHRADLQPLFPHPAGPDRDRRLAW